MTAPAPESVRIEGVAMARVRGGYLVVQLSLPVDTPGLTLMNPGELARPYSLAQATGVVRGIIGRIVQTLAARRM